MSRVVLLSLLLSTLTLSQSYSQTDSLNTDPEPIGGISKLALVYYKINFSEEQREILQGKEIEFIFSVNKEGIPTLEKINGISEESILDSLQNASDHIPQFYPRLVNGVPENSLYFMKLRLPTYRRLPNMTTYPPTFHYPRLKPEDLEYIQESPLRLDMLIGGATNFFIGKPAEYLSPGGGMKIDLVILNDEGIGGGMVMEFYGNKLKKEYPISSARKQNNAPPTLLLGLALNKSFYQKERSGFLLQLEICYAVQNVTPRLDYQDKDWTQLKGFSPGLVANYYFQLGRNGLDFFSYGTPALVSHNLNLHAGIRPIFLNLKEASGIMLEAGLSYRLGYRFIKEYRIKQDLMN